MPLTDAKVRSAKPAGKPYKLVDGGGLHLYVTPAGGRFWRWRYESQGRERLVSLGSYPEVTLAEARRRRDERRRQPGGTEPAVPEAAVTLEAVVREWHKIQGARWAAHHSGNVLASLEREIFPALGGLPAAKVDAPALLRVLRPIEQRGAIETAHRIRQRLEAAFAFAIAVGQVTSNPAAAVRKAMAPMPKGNHRPALLDMAAAREMLRRAETIPALPVTRLALRLLALTIVRPGEIRGAVWTEFEGLDGAAPVWRIPAERMKMRIEHVVPLPRQAVDVLQAARTVTGRGALVFPSASSSRQPLSENAIGYLLHRAGYQGQHVPHGWRATFSTVMNERHRGDRGVIDLMLAHVPKDAVERAYNRATHMDRRRELAQIWADLLMDGMQPAAGLSMLPRR